MGAGRGVEPLRESEDAGWVLGGAVGVSDSRSMSSSLGARGAKRLAVFPLLRRRCCVAISFVGCSSVEGTFVVPGASRFFELAGGVSYDVCVPSGCCTCFLVLRCLRVAHRHMLIICRCLDAVTCDAFFYGWG